MSRYIILLVFTIIIIYHICRIRQVRTLAYWENRNIKIIKTCRKLLKDVYDLIETDNKFLTSGTLLGSIRHQDIIPYDDDVDLGIYGENIDEINDIKYSIIKEAKKRNYICKEVFFGLKLIKNNCGVDIFFYISENNKYKFLSHKARKLWPSEYYYKKELIKYNKGIIFNNEYNICNNTINVLNRFYGTTWNEQYITHTHSFDVNNIILSNITLENISNFYLIKILKALNLNKVY
jgi:phosphorylcholine metabolism protein LicD